MKRRVLGLVAAVVLAGVGTAALVAYVRSARADAVAGEEQAQILVVVDDIAQGAQASEVRGGLNLVSVPVRLVAADALTSWEAFDALAAQDPTLVAAGDLWSRSRHPGRRHPWRSPGSR